MSLLKSRFIEMFGKLGNHHKDWKIAKFENFCEINPNKKSIENIEDSTEVSFIPMAAVSEKGEIDTSEIKTYSEVKKGFTSFSDKDVLFAKITPCMENGKGAVAEGLKNNLGFGSTEFHVLRPKQELCDSYWLYYLMSLPEFRKKAELNMKGSAGQKRVPANFLAKFEISLPPIGLQKVYIDFFNQIDKSKFLLQQILEKFELLKKSRFIEMFGKLGNHHKDWKIAKFENFCEINPNKKSIENIEDSTEVSFIPMAAVSEKGEIDTSEIKTYSEVKKGFTSFSDKDVLFAKITPCMENGKGAVAEGLKNNLGFGSTEFHVLRPKQELCDSYWLYYLMSLPEFRKKAELNMKGSAGQKRVPANFLAKFEISLPPIGLQKVYIDFFNQIDKSKLIIQKALEDLVGKV